MGSDPVILIVGAGPVGLTAALELARRGFRPRIVDCGPGPTPERESRALGIHGRTIELLSESGVGESLLRAGNRVRDVEIRRAGNPVYRLDLTRYGGPHPFVLILSQGRTERILETALGAYNTRVEWQTECTALALDGQRATVTLETGGNRETLHPDIVLGADGPDSIVRKSAGISFADTAREPQTFGLVDAVLSEPLDPTLFVINLLDDGALIRIPIANNLVRYISNRPDIGTAIPDTVSISSIAWNSTFQINYRRVETFQKGPIFVMGDAAHIHSPAGGRGMNLGMEDAAWFAWSLAENRLDLYSTDRIPYAKRTLKFSQTQTERMTGITRIQATLTAAVLPFVMKIPHVRQLALRNILAREMPPPPWLPEF